MLNELHRKVVYHSAELSLLVSMPFLLAIPKSLLNKHFYYAI